MRKKRLSVNNRYGYRQVDIYLESSRIPYQGSMPPARVLIILPSLRNYYTYNPFMRTNSTAELVLSAPSSVLARSTLSFPSGEQDFYARSKGDVRRAINGVRSYRALLILKSCVRAREERERGRSGPSFVFKSVPGRSRKRANDRLSSSPSKHNFLAATVVVVDHHPSSIFQPAR